MFESISFLVTLETAPAFKNTIMNIQYNFTGFLFHERPFSVYFH